MKLISAQIWYHTNDYCHGARYFSSKKSYQAKKIAKTNFELKQMYGAAIRGEKENETVETKPIDSSHWAHTKYKHKSSMASEIHWLTGHTAHVKHLKVMSSKSKSTPLSESSSLKTLSESLTTNTNGFGSHKLEDTKSLLNSTEDMLRKFNSLKPDCTSAIPFDDANFKSILKYPLVCQKATNTEMDDALKTHMPSISKILTATMPEASRNALEKWKLGKIAELGEDGFNEYQQMTLKLGQTFHSSIENYLKHQQVPDENSSVYKLWQSVGSVLIELDPKPVLIEKSIVHPHLKYKGIIDSVAVIKDTMCALEWKTSEKLKPRLVSTYDAPIQLCAYLGALNIDPRYEISAQNGYVVVAYKDGTRANAFYLSEKDVKGYWSAWLKRVEEFWIRTRDGTLPEPI